MPKYGHNSAIFMGITQNKFRPVTPPPPPLAVGELFENNRKHVKF